MTFMFQNVLIKKNEETGDMTAVVGDFGLAAKIPDPRSRYRLPTVGSPYWMSPECLKGQWYDERSDVFSYGIVLCELIARVEADPDVMPRTENFGLDYIAFSQLCGPGVPPEFLQLAFLCCTYEPKSRPPFSEVVERLTVQLRAFDAPSRSPVEVAAPVPQTPVDCKPSRAVLGARSEEVIAEATVVAPPEGRAAVTHASASRKLSHRRSLSEEVQIPFMAPSDKARCHPMSPRAPASPPPELPSLVSVGESMVRRDPHYKPRQQAQNPFTALAQFRGARKLLGGDWGEGDSFSSCFELPSPYFSAHTEDKSLSLPSSPTAMRRALNTPRQTTPNPSPPRKACMSLFSHPLFATRTKGVSPQTRPGKPGSSVATALWPPRVFTSSTNLAEESDAGVVVGYPLLRRRGSCESGFFSVGDGERTSTSDLSPDCQASLDGSVAAALGRLSSSGGLLGSSRSSGELRDLLDEYSSLQGLRGVCAKRSSSIYTDSSEDISSLGGGDYSWDEALRPSGAVGGLSNPHHIHRIVEYFERKQRLSAEDPRLASAWLARQHRELLFQAASRKYPTPSGMSADAAFEALSHRLARVSAAAARSPKIAQIQKSLVSVPVERPVVKKTSIPQRLSICEGTVRSKLQLFDKK
ncbi:hypothetical protein B566_EDAN006909 [Ephemera danica]|nr:hypothetical protein B566_EDAN006909 [Ephemera danica]